MTAPQRLPLRRRGGLAVALIALLAGGAWAGPADSLDVGADSVRYVEQPQRLVVAKGHVRVGYQGLTVTADELTADLDAETAVFKGGVVLSAEGGDFDGDTLFLDLRTRRWEFAQTRAALPPDFFGGGGVVEPLYLSARRVTGGPTVLADDASFTTCSREHPHWRIEARHVTIYPGRKLVARRASLWVGEHRVVVLPHFWVSLKEPSRQPFIPQIGENDIDGRYLKTLFNYVMSESQWGRLHLDFMSRRGFGTGVDHNLSFAKGLSQLSLYQASNRETGDTEFTGRLTHEQQLADDTTLRLASDYRRYAPYYLAGSTVMSNTLNLTKQTSRSVTSLSLNDNRSEGYTDLGSTTLDLRHDRTGRGASRSFQAGYQRRTTFPGQADDQELTTRINLLDRQRRLDLTLLASRRFDLDGEAFAGDDYYYVLDRLPELVANTDLNRLGLAAAAALPTRLEVRFGRFHEQPTNLSAYRAYLGADASPKPLRLDSRTTLTTALRFQQTAYGDEDRTARYAYGLTSRLHRDLTPVLSADVNYYLMEPKGYSPFQFDYLGAYRWATTGLSYQRGLRQRASLLTGFDTRSSRWQDLMLRIETPLSRTLSLVGATSYDLNEGEQRDMVAQARFDDFRTALSLGLRYDPRISTWRRVSAELDWQATPKWRIGYLTAYDGLTHDFVYNEAVLTRDLHCWEARLYYSEQSDLLRLDLRIKAFEFGAGGFGTGRFGQRLDTSQAQPY